MARYNRAYTGDRRTEFVGFQLTQQEREELEKAAEQQGATISAYARELLFRRSAAVVAATKRNPEAAEIMGELRAIGNNLNQIARVLNTTGELGDEARVRIALDWHKQAIMRVLSL